MGEYRLHSWQCDYHFNVNVQECYWPALPGNRTALLGPVRPDRLVGAARLDIAHEFLGLRDGLMLHHAVDGRCTCMGGFWTGAIDHGSTGWVSVHDVAVLPVHAGHQFLRRTAYPFMRDTLRVLRRCWRNAPMGRSFCR